MFVCTIGKKWLCRNRTRSGVRESLDTESLVVFEMKPMPEDNIETGFARRLLLHYTQGEEGGAYLWDSVVDLAQNCQINFGLIGQKKLCFNLPPPPSISAPC